MLSLYINHFKNKICQCYGQHTSLKNVSMHTETVIEQHTNSEILLAYYNKILTFKHCKSSILLFNHILRIFHVR
jgi:hypothetical protein